jgi:hypothetical protein
MIIGDLDIMRRDLLVGRKFIKMVTIIPLILKKHCVFEKRKSFADHNSWDEWWLH